LLLSVAAGRLFFAAQRVRDEIERARIQFDGLELESSALDSSSTA